MRDLTVGRIYFMSRPDEIGGIDRVPVAPLSIAKTGDVNWFDRA